jgi:hypothetical protein
MVTSYKWILDFVIDPKKGVTLPFFHVIEFRFYHN